MAKSNRKTTSKSSRRNAQMRVSDDTKVKFLVKDNPRREGTRAHKVQGAALKISKGKPWVDMGTLKSKAKYMPFDLASDIEHGYAKVVA